MQPRYDPNDNMNAFVVFLGSIMLLLSSIVLANEGRYISLDALSISYDGNLFSINTVINILALFGLLAYRIELGKLWFNLCSTINNFLLFIPYFCLLFFISCAFTIPTILIRLISASWGYEDPIDNDLIPGESTIFDEILPAIKKFNGIREAVE